MYKLAFLVLIHHQKPAKANVQDMNQIISTKNFQTMGNLQNHLTLVDKVNLYLDNELSKEAERELLIELKQNPIYRDVLSKEKSFREFLRSRIQRRKVSPALIQSIKDKIKTTA